MKKLLLAVLLVAFVAMPAFASVQNIKISGTVATEWIMRDDFDFGSAPNSSNSVDDDIEQNIFVAKTYLLVEADLTDNVSTTVRLANERDWNRESGQTGVVISQAYATLREMVYSPLTVMVGRQKISYGNKMIIGGGINLGDSRLGTVASDRQNLKAFDAVRAILDYNPLTIDIFYAKDDENTATEAGDTDDDVDLYGINATYELGDDMDTQVETYFFAKLDKSTQAPTNAGNKSSTIYCPGLRVSSNPIEGLSISAEYAHQSGTRATTTRDSSNNYHVSNQSRDANAAQVIANYQVPALEDYNPVLNYTFAWFSGDNDVNSQEGVSTGTLEDEETYTAWDEMYEGIYGGSIADTLLPLSNLKLHTVALTVNPIEDVTSRVSWTGIWFDKDVHANNTSQTINSPASASNVITLKAAESYVGSEVGWVTTYNYTEDVTIGANLGWLFPGDAIDDSVNGDTARQALVNVDVNF